LRKRERGSTNESTKREQGSAPVLHSVETIKKKKENKKKKVENSPEDGISLCLSFSFVYREFGYLT
jgi:hypothetical protein